MQRLVQTLRQIARHEVEQHFHPQLAVVKSVHGNDGTQALYACTVQLRETNLVLPKVPIATGMSGSAGLPLENDLVVVLFVNGDLHAPLVIGRLHHKDLPPPKNEPGDWVAALPADETSADKRLDLKVSTPGDGTRSLTLTLDGSVQVQLKLDDGGIELKAQDAVFKLTQSSSSNGRAELTVGEAKVTLNQNGDVNVEASGTLTLKANKIEISGDTSVKVAGQTIDLN